MKSRTGAGLGFIVLALCLVLLLVLVQGVANTPFRSAARPIASPIQPTALPTVDIVATGQSAAATLAVQATATTAALPPMVTPEAIVGPQTIFDPVNLLSLELPPNWYADVSSSSSQAYAAALSISSYDFNSVDATTVPKDGVSIDIYTGPIPSDKTFEEWVAEQQQAALTPQEGATSAFFVSTEPLVPIEFNSLKGFAFDALSQRGASWKTIYLLSGDGRHIAISIRPFDDATRINTDIAMSMLSTLKIIPKR